MNIFYCVLIILLFSAVGISQNFIIEANASLEVQINADICADSLGGEGTIIINGTFCGSTTDLDIKSTDSSLTIPDVFALKQNYPNPFNPNTIINYQLPISCEVSLKIYDVLGNEVATLVNEQKSAGSYEVIFDATGLSSGIYFYKLQAGNLVDTKKMILLR